MSLIILHYVYYIILYYVIQGLKPILNGSRLLNPNINKEIPIFETKIEIVKHKY